VKLLGKFFSLSFLWGFFQWFYTAADGCGFQAFPSLGLKAYENKYVVTSPFSIKLIHLEMKICIICTEIEREYQLFV